MNPNKSNIDIGNEILAKSVNSVLLKKMKASQINNKQDGILLSHKTKVKIMQTMENKKVSFSKGGFH